MPIGTQLNSPHTTGRLLREKMGKMVIAVASGILEGLLISAGMFTKNALALVVAVVFFVIQWRHLGRQE